MDPRINDELQARGVHPRIVTTLLEIGLDHDLEICSGEGTGLLALAADPEAYAAVYVGKNHLSIAMDPDVALSHGKRTGWRVESKTNATSYLHAQAEDIVGDAAPFVTELLIAALDRSYQRSRWKRSGPDQTRLQGTVCPQCGLQMSLLGRCDDCDA
jgi:hypothetical protein